MVVVRFVDAVRKRSTVRTSTTDKAQRRNRWTGAARWTDVTVITSMKECRDRIQNRLLSFSRGCNTWWLVVVVTHLSSFGSFFMYLLFCPSTIRDFRAKRKKAIGLVGLQTYGAPVGYCTRPKFGVVNTILNGLNMSALLFDADEIPAKETRAFCACARTQH